MKTIITTTIIATSLLLTGINTLNKNYIIKPVKEEVPFEDNIKIYKPIFTPLSPTCPSAEYQLVSMNRQAENQLGIVHTEHCAKCNMGALYQKEDKKVCTYCEYSF